MAQTPSASRDAIVAAAIVGGLLLGVYLWSGVWPPMVVVESGSMMHCEGCVPYGRVGTIDPGDMVFVKQLDPYANGGRGDVELFGDPGGDTRFGKSGDVIIFFRNGNRETTPIIHRAVAWVDVVGTGTNRTYSVLFKGEVLEFNATGIVIGEIGVTSPLQPLEDGYLTKGDNPGTNSRADQAFGIAPTPIKPEWIEGKARGEVPWFGLIKLTIGSEVKNAPGDEPSAQYWVRIGNVYAPSDLWVMLASALVALVLVPLAWDVWRAWRDRHLDEGAFEPLEAARPERPIVKPLPPAGPVRPLTNGPTTRFEVVRRE